MTADRSGKSSTTAASVTASLTPEGLAVDVHSESGFFLRADEPGDVGGSNTGPDPFTYLYTSLASCMLITIRMYAQRKEWPLEGATIRLIPGERQGYVLKSIEYELDLEGPLDDKQINRLRDIAHKCPVHRSIEAAITISERESR